MWIYEQFNRVVEAGLASHQPPAYFQKTAAELDLASIRIIEQKGALDGTYQLKFTTGWRNMEVGIVKIRKDGLDRPYLIVLLKCGSNLWFINDGNFMDSYAGCPTQTAVPAAYLEEAFAKVLGVNYFSPLVN